MKRRILIKKFTDKGWYLERHGASHDIYTNGVNKEMIPRHPDVKEKLAKGLVKKWGL